MHKWQVITACPAALQVISFAGELLSNAEGLLRDGLHTSEVADGYTKAADKASVRLCSKLGNHCNSVSTATAPVACQDCGYVCLTNLLTGTCPVMDAGAGGDR